MLIPAFSKGNPEIPDVVYENMKNLWIQKEEEKAKAKETEKK